MLLSNFINNEFVAPSSNLYLDNFEPATGQVYGKVPRSNAVDVEHAVTAAKSAFKSWKKTTAKDRSAMLYRIADLIQQVVSFLFFLLFVFFFFFYFSLTFFPEH